MDSNGAVPVEGGLWRLSCVLLRKPSVRDRLDGRPCLQVSLSGTSPTVWPFTVYDCTLPLQIPHSHDDTGWQRNVDQYYEEEVRYIYDTVVSSLRANSARRFIFVETAYFMRSALHIPASLLPSLI